MIVNPGSVPKKFIHSCPCCGNEFFFDMTKAQMIDRYMKTQGEKNIDPGSIFFICPECKSVLSNNDSKPYKNFVYKCASCNGYAFKSMNISFLEERRIRKIMIPEHPLFNKRLCHICHESLLSILN